ncbi:MAG: polysaccharide biosynthesis/export family protein [Gemmatimonadales bacterium]
MRGTLLTILMLAGLASSAMAQITVDGQRPLATREELERALQQMTPQERDGSKGKIVRQRLAEGDILPGDKIRISVAGDTTLSGTFTVRGDGTLVAPNVDPISVRGVLRSELEAHLAKELQKYLRNPTVTASSLVRIAVSGSVARAGFYDLPPESAASDAIVAAGGLGGDGDVQKTIVRRNAEPLYDKQQVREFFVSGASLDQMGLHTGDEFFVGRRGSANVLPIIGAVTGIAFAVAAFAGLF